MDSAKNNVHKTIFNKLKKSTVKKEGRLDAT